MDSTLKSVLDVLLCVCSTFISSTTMLAVSTVNWHIDGKQERIGLFERCHQTCCCTTKELHRTVTILVLFSLLLLFTSTLTSILFMITTVQRRYRLYMIVPLTTFGAGMTMTLTLIHIIGHISINSYSAFIFLIDTVLAFVLGGLTLLHGSLFYCL
jgi:hypothetical protein